MRIQAIYARNFLSFTDVAITGLADFNTFVGPNGAGKTNVLRVLQHLRDVLAGGSKPQYASYVNANAPEKGYRIAIDVEWTTADERELIMAYFAMVLQEQRAVRDLTNGRGYTSEGEVETWCRRVDAMLSTDAMQPLFAGHLAFEWTPSSSIHNQYASYSFTVNGKLLHWLLGLNSPNCITTDLSAFRRQPQVSQSLPKLWAESNGNRSELLIRFFQGEQPDLASLRWDWAEIYDVLDVLIDKANPLKVISLDAQSENLNDHDLPSFKKVLAATNTPVTPVRVITGAQVMFALLHPSLALSPNRRSPPESFASWETLTNTRDVFEDAADLPRMLYMLKNGTPQARTNFKAIQTAFQVLTHKTLELEAIPRADGTGMDIRLQVTDPQRPQIWVPLDRAGTGIEDTLYWATLAHLQNRKVVALDEPGANLHPDLQERLRQYFQKSAFQVLVITHSPYMVSPDHLVNTYRIDQTNGESRVRSGALSNNARQASKSNKLRDLARWSADTRALLFASQVVLVEGESEAAAIPIWLSKAARKDAHSLSAANMTLQWIEGKGNAMHYLYFLESFGVPWTYLCDGDALQSGGGNVFAALKHAQIEVSRSVCCAGFPEKKQWLLDHRVWVRGNEENDCFETLPEYKQVEKKIPSDLGGSKVLRGRWVAEHTACPREFQSFFDWLLGS